MVSQHYSTSCGQLPPAICTKRPKGMSAVLKANNAEPTVTLAGVKGKPPRPPGSKFDGVSR